MIKYLSIEHLKLINQGLDQCDYKVVRVDELERAVVAPQRTFAGSDLYPEIYSKAACLLIEVAQAHAFLDGNKRTAWYAFTTFLDINGIYLNEDMAGYQDDFMVDVVTRQLDRYAIERHIIWLLGLGS